MVRQLKICVCAIGFGLCLMTLFVVGATAAEADESIPTPRPTATAVSIVPSVIGEDLVDLFRIEDVFRCGHTVNECLMSEPDALVMARIALGEAPSSPSDQVYIMWNLRLSAYLGYKNAGAYSGWNNDPARWGPPTTIKREALCVGGCQYEVVRVAMGYFYPCQMPETAGLRLMLCPLTDDLPRFAFAYEAALQILAADILRDYPEELKGYETFRSAWTEGLGRRQRAGGLQNQQFFPRANVWRDESPDDNIFWRMVAAGRLEWPSEARFVDPVTPAARQLRQDHQLRFVSQLSPEEIRLWDCGPAAGATILGSYFRNQTFHAYDFYNDMGMRDDTYETGATLQEWIAARGLVMDSVPLESAELRTMVSSRPVIAYLPGHWLVVAGYVDGLYLLYDPMEFGPTFVNADEFDGRVALYVLAPSEGLW